MGKREMNKKTKPAINYSKKLINDIRWLLWAITLGGIALAFYCVYKDYTSSLPWVTSMVGLPWASHATVCSLYLNKSKAENTAADGTGIIYAAAQAKGFMEEYESNKQKYQTEAKPEDEIIFYYPPDSYEENNFGDDYYNSPPI